jgi:hypothetical protein
MLQHIDSCHVPHSEPSSAVPTRSHTPVPDDEEARTSSGTEHTLTGENPNMGDAGDAEKRLRKRAPNGGPLQEQGAKQGVPAEERDWQDDIVT